MAICTLFCVYVLDVVSVSTRTKHDGNDGNNAIHWVGDFFGGVSDGNNGNFGNDAIRAIKDNNAIRLQ